MTVVERGNEKSVGSSEKTKYARARAEIPRVTFSHRDFHSGSVVTQFRGDRGDITGCLECNRGLRQSHWSSTEHRSPVVVLPLQASRGKLRR